MDSNNEVLHQLTIELQRRFGTKALHRGKPAFPPLATSLPSGFSSLDHLLNGGFRRGQIVELISTATSGGTSVALGTIARAQQQREQAAYLYLTRALDLEYASRCGVSLEQLLLVQPYTWEDLLAITDELIRSDAVGVLVVNATNDLAASVPRRVLETGLRRIATTLYGSHCALLFLTSLNGRAASQAATLTILSQHAQTRLHLAVTRWQRRKRCITGYHAAVAALKGPRLAGQRTTIHVPV